MYVEVIASQMCVVFWRHDVETSACRDNAGKRGESA